ncbi:hypothetical protein LINPERHAP1_LOCUS14221 [Linum perenne]
MSKTLIFQVDAIFCLVFRPCHSLAPSCSPTGTPIHFSSFMWSIEDNVLTKCGVGCLFACLSFDGR